MSAHGRQVAFEAKASYTFVRDLLQLRGLADEVRGQGRYLRKRERRPMPGRAPARPSRRSTAC